MPVSLTSGHAALFTIAYTSKSCHGQSPNLQTSSFRLTSQLVRHRPRLSRCALPPSTTCHLGHVVLSSERCSSPTLNYAHRSRISSTSLGFRESRYAICPQSHRMSTSMRRRWLKRRSNSPRSMFPIFSSPFLLYNSTRLIGRGYLFLLFFPFPSSLSTSGLFTILWPVSSGAFDNASPSFLWLSYKFHLSLFFV